VTATGGSGERGGSAGAGRKSSAPHPGAGRSGRDGHETQCDLGAQSENDPEYGAFICALMSGFDVSWGDVEAGTRFIVNALRGFGARHHFDLYHPEQVERGIEDAPPEGAARAAWMYGYRFEEHKGGRTTGRPGSTESDGNSRESDGSRKCSTREHVESIDKPGFCVWCDLPRSEWVPLVMRQEPSGG